MTEELMQKPVELRPDAILPDIADDEGCIPIYIEHRYVMSLEAGIYDQLTDSILFSGNSEWHDNEGQGISWRPWLKKPTPKERDAAADDPEHYAEEAADVTIMTGDVCAYLGIDWHKAVMDKKAYNKTRSWKHQKE